MLLLWPQAEVLLPAVIVQGLRHLHPMRPEKKINMEKNYVKRMDTVVELAELPSPSALGGARCTSNLKAWVQGFEGLWGCLSNAFGISAVTSACKHPPLPEAR